MGDILPFCFIGERLRTPVEDGDGAKSMSSIAPNLLCQATGSFAPLVARSLLSFWFPFWWDHVFLSAGFERLAATDFVVVEAAVFLSATREAPTVAGIDDVLHLSVIEIEVFVLFSEVSESIWLSLAWVDISFVEGAFEVDA